MSPRQDRAVTSSKGPAAQAPSWTRAGKGNREHEGRMEMEKEERREGERKAAGKVNSTQHN